MVIPTLFSASLLCDASFDEGGCFGPERPPRSEALPWFSVEFVLCWEVFVVRDIFIFSQVY